MVRLHVEKVDCNVVHRQVWRDSAGEYQADERAGVAALLASIRLMSRQVSRGSAGDY